MGNLNSKRRQRKSLKNDSEYQLKKNLIQSHPIFDKSLTNQAPNQPRVCFISLFHLYMEWRCIPKHILYSSLVIANCNRSFFTELCGLQPTIVSHDSIVGGKRSQTPNLESMDSSIHRSSCEQALSQLYIAEDCEFLSLIFQKEEHGNILWLDSTVTDHLRSDSILNDMRRQSQTVDMPIDPKWLLMSAWLESQTDTVTQHTYMPIQLSQSFWRQRYQEQVEILVDEEVQYTYGQLFSQICNCDSIVAVITEIEKFGNRFQPFLEILRQSNPSLIAMAKWDETLFNERSKLIRKVYRNDHSSSSSGDNETDMFSKSADKNDIKSTLARRINFGLEDENGFVYLF